jgi:hypothetical protein
VIRRRERQGAVVPVQVVVAVEDHVDVKVNVNVELHRPCAVDEGFEAPTRRSRGVAGLVET